jgi:hypothetical protein
LEGSSRRWGGRAAPTEMAAFSQGRTCQVLHLQLFTKQLLQLFLPFYLQKAMLLFFYSTLAFIQTTGTVVAMLLQYLVSVLW